jgi:hypothetical protein
MQTQVKLVLDVETHSLFSPQSLSEVLQISGQMLVKSASDTPLRHDPSMSVMGLEQTMLHVVCGASA